MDAETFWANMNKEGECWEWQRYRYRNGYGYVCWRGKKYLTHRLAYQLTFGLIPSGLWVLHRCDNPPCCNPTHLFTGTPKDNTRDALRKGRMATGDRCAARLYPERRPRGSKVGTAKLTDQQVREIRNKYAAGNVFQRQLAAEYGVCRPQISAIVTRTQWAHL
jgi:hypothetical protein